MHRFFLPVGEGAFYAECFYGGISESSPINVVYDCGTRSANAKALLANAAKIPFGSNVAGRKKETIHAVFISHFHDDHIEGLPLLLQKYNVKRIYFPLLENENKLLMKTWHEIQGSTGFAYQFLMNPKEAIRDKDPPPDLQLIAVGDEADRHGATDLGVDFHVSGWPIGIIDFDGVLGSFLPGTPFRNWIYVPFNIESDQFVNNVITALRNLLQGKPLSEHELKLLLEDPAKRQGVINAFTTAGSYTEINTNSQVVFSGLYDTSPLRQTIIQSGKGQPQSLNKTYTNLPAGCLFTGDYNAKGGNNGRGNNPWLELYKAYAHYWQFIGCLQVPHHGSGTSFNPNFLSQFGNIIYAVSAGEKYTRHPALKVQNDFITNQKEYFKISEDPNSMLRICIK